MHRTFSHIFESYFVSFNRTYRFFPESSYISFEWIDSQICNHFVNNETDAVFSILFSSLSSKQCFPDKREERHIQKDRMAETPLAQYPTSDVVTTQLGEAPKIQNSPTKSEGSVPHIRHPDSGDWHCATSSENLFIWKSTGIKVRRITEMWGTESLLKGLKSKLLALRSSAKATNLKAPRP